MDFSRQSRIQADPTSLLASTGLITFQIIGKFAATAPDANNGGLLLGSFDFDPAQYDASIHSAATPLQLTHWNIKTMSGDRSVFGTTYAPGPKSSGTVALNESGQWCFEFHLNPGDVYTRLQFITPIGVTSSSPEVIGNELKGTTPLYRSRQLASIYIVPRPSVASTSSHASLPSVSVNDACTKQDAPSTIPIASEFAVTMVAVHYQGRRLPKVVVQQKWQQVSGYVELIRGVDLEMVAIPAGAFLMGSPEDEPGHHRNESPQHPVRISAFFMGKYPVTQAQWRAVAGLPQVERTLEPDPSTFKGENLPVEQVSWLDAVEFCARLSQFTGKSYRLPTEAEWEYACRAGTTTPFHFGETITPRLANYLWSQTYNVQEMQEDSEGTTPVGQFGVANAFGLYDMHGNVWEWCEDAWHASYRDAPADGSAWLRKTLAAEVSHVLRGGSWGLNPEHCRSASRYFNPAKFRSFNFGFRVACSS